MAKSKKKIIINKRAATDDDMAIGNRIRSLRINRGMSQGALGDILKVSFQQIQKYEKGVNRVSGTTLMKLSEIFETTLDDITGKGQNKIDVSTQFDSSSYKMSRQFNRLPKTFKIQLEKLAMMMEQIIKANT
jgi:transcriptional regulator with XRE-family HTH domain